MRRIGLGLCGVILSLCGASLGAQTAPLTDPAAIAAECGGTAEAGADLFYGLCSACHTLQPDETATLAGPHLGNLMDRAIGSVEGFDYSPALRLLGADGTAWERESLRAFLATATGSSGHPRIEDLQIRNDLMTYIRIETLPPPPALGELVVPPDVLALAGDPAYGEYLGSECASCHAEGATAPALDGYDRTSFITALHEYRARARAHDAMRAIAARLTDEDIAALAAWFTQG